MANPTPQVPRSEKAGKDERQVIIYELDDPAPQGYDGVAVAPYLAQQTTPVADNGRPYPTARLEVIERSLRIHGWSRGHRSTHATCVREPPKCDARGPDITVGFGNGSLATPRTFEMQSGPTRTSSEVGRWLRLRGRPGTTGHPLTSVFGMRPGAQPRSVDGFFDLLPQDPPHFTLCQARMRESGPPARRRCHLLSGASSGGDRDGVLTSE